MPKDYLNILPPSSLSSRKSRVFWLFSLVVVMGFNGTKFLRFSLSPHSIPMRTLSQNPLPSIPDLKEYLQHLSPSQKKDIDLIARTVFGEARGEKSFKSLQAIAHVILNRVKGQNWPNSVQAVIFQKNQFSCWNQTDPNYYLTQSVTFNNADFRQAYQATLVAIMSKTDITHGANHYHARWVDPTWAHKKNMIRVAEIRQHIFYKA
jgi:N-acetylmuramoyl-L-alanine amidase